MNENDIFEMINTDGEKESFSYLATIELNNELYICAEPVDHSMVEFEDEEEDEESVPVLFFHCQFAQEDKPDSEDIFTIVTDDALQEELFDKFLEQLEDEVEEVDDDNEDGDTEPADGDEE
jgi:hypothetical protein